MSKTPPPSIDEYVWALSQRAAATMSAGTGLLLSFFAWYYHNETLGVFSAIGAVAAFVFAGYDVWRRERLRVVQLESENETPERISLLDFARVAERDFGWNFESGWEVLDLKTGLEHAANDGRITFEGKEFGPFGMPSSSPFIRTSTLYSVIGREEWLKSRLHIDIPGLSIAAVQDNFDIKIASFSDAPLPRFDAHISDQAAALAWLENSGPKFKGQSERLHLVEEVRREKLRLNSPFEDTEQGVADVPRQIPKP